MTKLVTKIIPVRVERQEPYTFGGRKGVWTLSTRNPTKRSTLRPNPGPRTGCPTVWTHPSNQSRCLHLFRGARGLGCPWTSEISLGWLSEQLKVVVWSSFLVRPWVPGPVSLRGVRGWGPGSQTSHTCHRTPTVRVRLVLISSIKHRPFGDKDPTEPMLGDSLVRDIGQHSDIQFRTHTHLYLSITEYTEKKKKCF